MPSDDGIAFLYIYPMCYAHGISYRIYGTMIFDSRRSSMPGGVIYGREIYQFHNEAEKVSTLKEARRSKKTPGMEPEF